MRKLILGAALVVAGTMSAKTMDYYNVDVIQKNEISIDMLANNADLKLMPLATCKDVHAVFKKTVKMAGDVEEVTYELVGVVTRTYECDLGENSLYIWTY